jgi:hypothetical protein
MLADQGAKKARRETPFRRSDEPTNDRARRAHSETRALYNRLRIASGVTACR